MKTVITLLFTFCMSMQLCSDFRQSVSQALGFNSSVTQEFEDAEAALLEEIRLNRLASKAIIGNLGHRDELREKAEHIRQLTDRMVHYIRDYREEFIKHTDIRYEGGQLVNLTKSREQMLFSLGKEKDGKAYELQQKLNDFVLKINAISPQLEFQIIALNGWEMEQAESQSKLQRTDFAHLHFDNTPNYRCLSTIRAFHAEVTRLELSALTKIAELDMAKFAKNAPTEMKAAR